MTHEEFQTQLQSIPDLELIEKANAIVSKLCKTGGNAFTMCVPPRLNDSDIILSEVIRRLSLKAE